MSPRPLCLIVLDGWGFREASENNAIKNHADVFQRYLAKYPHCLLSASGKEVGLPLGLMGNSEVGHMNLGAGRVVYQDVTRIDKSIEDGDFFENGAFVTGIERAVAQGKCVHLLGLLGDGGVHASERHLRELLRMCAQRGVPADRVLVHVFTDGRDTAPRSGAGYMARLEADIEAAGVGRIASVIGRYWAMDRDKRWERVERAYDLLTLGAGKQAAMAAETLEQSYAEDVTDEFCEPWHVGPAEAGRIADGDSVICFNYRSDRMRQICQALGLDDFDGFERRRRVRPEIVTMTQYRADFPFALAYPPQRLSGIFPELVSAAGLRQARMAETEKYAHVTFFFSGGQEAELPGESRTLIQSPRVATYDLQPEMSAFELKDAILASVKKGAEDVYIINFANADMVGHTGIPEAAIRAVQAVDRCLGEIVPAVLDRGGAVAITADHGNAEMMWDSANNQPHTAHTTNPVPFVLCAGDLVGAKLRPMGILADVAPTLLELLEVDPSEGMDGVSLLEG